MNQQSKIEYKGTCLCRGTTYKASQLPIDPHLCSCNMCQKSSGAPTVAWVSFPLSSFEWTKDQPKLYQSSKKTKRCFCSSCGCLLAAVNDGCDSICVTICSLENPDLVSPNKTHSFKESAPKWMGVYH